jgi:hypothetical protein
MHPETTRRLAAHRQAELAGAMSAARRARHPGRPRPRWGRPAWLRLAAARMWPAHARPLPGRQVL